MQRIDSMPDIHGNTVKVGDFVQLTEGKKPYINKAMKKDFVFKVAYMENRPSGGKDYFVAFLTGKTGNGGIYSSGCTPKEIRKVNYDIKKRKIIEYSKVSACFEKIEFVQIQKDAPILQRVSKHIANEFPVDTILGIVKELKKKGFNNEDILFKQKEGWESPQNQELNNVSYETLSMLLNSHFPVIIQEPTKEELVAELDYELANLYHAISHGDEMAIVQSKQRLTEIHKQLEL